MPINLGTLSMTGSMRFQSEGLGFSIHFEHSKWIASFASFGDLLSAKKEATQLLSAIKSLPRLPSPPGKSAPVSKSNYLGNTIIWVTVKERPVGKLIPDKGSLKFQPTPLSFFTKAL